MLTVDYHLQCSQGIQDPPCSPGIRRQRRICKIGSGHAEAASKPWVGTGVTKHRSTIILSKCHEQVLFFFRPRGDKQKKDKAKKQAEKEPKDTPSKETEGDLADEKISYPEGIWDELVEDVWDEHVEDVQAAEAKERNHQIKSNQTKPNTQFSNLHLFHLSIIQATSFLLEDDNEFWPEEDIYSEEGW